MKQREGSCGYDSSPRPPQLRQVTPTCAMCASSLTALGLRAARPFLLLRLGALGGTYEVLVKRTGSRVISTLCAPFDLVEKNLMAKRNARFVVFTAGGCGTLGYAVGNRWRRGGEAGTRQGDGLAG